MAVAVNSLWPYCIKPRSYREEGETRGGNLGPFWKYKQDQAHRILMAPLIGSRVGYGQGRILGPERLQANLPAKQELKGRAKKEG
jgi:hypothetical protein